MLCDQMFNRFSYGSFTDFKFSKIANQPNESHALDRLGLPLVFFKDQENRCFKIV
jgi:hypothetical protein